MNHEGPYDDCLLCKADLDKIDSYDDYEWWFEAESYDRPSDDDRKVKYWYPCTACAASGEIVISNDAMWTFTYAACKACEGLGAQYRRPMPYFT